MGTGGQTGTAGAAGTAQEAAQRRLAHHQFAAEMLRARRVLLVAAALWVVVGTVLDLVAFPVLGRGSLWLVLGLRWGACAYHVAFVAVLFRKQLPSERFTIAMGATLFPLTAAALTVMSARMGGLTSPYPATLFVILTAQVLALPQRWQVGLVVALASALVFPIGMLVMSTFDGQVHHDLGNQTATIWFYIFMVSLSAEVIIVVWGGHVIWSLRRSAFESKSIGRYRLLARIGAGGMGEVWKARDKATSRDVALKILSQDHGRSPAGVARFEREIQATAELTHPNTVRIHDWGITQDGVWYYAMELLHGLDLGSLVRRHGRLPAALVAKLGAEAARALAEAHGKGIVHRDIKPGNLFAVAVAGQVDYIKVLDFGVARVSEGGNEDVQLTQVGAVMGTPGFIAPEVLAGAQAGPPADIYGLAATLAFALTGSSPVAGRLAAPAGVELPPTLTELLERGLDADPQRRPASVAQLASDLVATGLPASYGGDFALLPAGARAGDGGGPGDAAALETTIESGSDHVATPREAPVARGRGTP